jgi:hypothetical protein
VRDGAEWRPEGEHELRPGTSPAGVLAVVFDGVTLRAEFTPAIVRGKDEFDVHVALLGCGLVSKVTAGENSGATLRQEFVALALATHPLVSNDTAHRAEFALPAPTVKDVPRRALAAWVTRRGKFEPVQATGGWLAP